MASVASSFEIAGHQATDALAEEIFNAEGSSLTFPGGWTIEVDKIYAKKREKREFFVVIRYNCGEAVELRGIGRGVLGREGAVGGPAANGAVGARRVVALELRGVERVEHGAGLRSVPEGGVLLHVRA